MVFHKLSYTFTNCCIDELWVKLKGISLSLKYFDISLYCLQSFRILLLWHCLLAHRSGWLFIPFLYPLKSLLSLADPRESTCLVEEDQHTLRPGNEKELLPLCHFEWFISLSRPLLLAWEFTLSSEPRRAGCRRSVEVPSSHCSKNNSYQINNLSASGGVCLHSAPPESFNK